MEQQECRKKKAAAKWEGVKTDKGTGWHKGSVNGREWKGKGGL